MTNEELLDTFESASEHCGIDKSLSHLRMTTRAELLRRLGAAASPQPRCPECKSIKINRIYGFESLAVSMKEVTEFCVCRSCNHDGPISQFFAAAPAQEPDEDEIVRLSLEDWRYGCFVGEWSEVEAQRLLEEGQAIAEKLHDAVSKLAKLRGLTFMTFSAQEQPVENSPQKGKP